MPYILYSSINRQIGCFHILAFVNNATMNKCVPFQINVFIFIRYIPRSEIAVSYGTSIFNFFEKPLY